MIIPLNTLAYNLPHGAQTLNAVTIFVICLLPLSCSLSASMKVNNYNSKQIFLLIECRVCGRHGPAAVVKEINLQKSPTILFLWFKVLLMRFQGQSQRGWGFPLLSAAYSNVALPLPHLLLEAIKSRK